MIVTRLRAVLGGAALLLAACSSTNGTPQGASSLPADPTSAAPSTAPSSSSAAPSSSSAAPTSTSPSPRPSSSSAPPQSAAERVLAGLSLAQRVGQLLMVDCPSTQVSGATVSAIERDHVGSVILDGNSQLSISGEHTITSDLQSDAPRGVGLLIATDQEGGLVQRLRGPGFDQVPSAVQQGGFAPSALQADAQRWGGQLRQAGVNVDLAPVLDTVPSGFGSNPPIGDLDREYGHDPTTVATHGVAAVRGLSAANVAATIKHFPGLGRVRGNTDTTSGVTDTVTTTHDAYLQPFAAAIDANVPLVMMSTAIYARIDPGTPAAFSHTIVTGLLRGQLGYRGVVISDDLGAARQVGAYSLGSRAVDFVAAGGDLVLTVNATQSQAMTQALLQKAGSDPGFRRLVDAAALRVLQLKQRLGLLG